MKTFILDADHNITVYASQQEAASAVPAGDAFTTAAGLKAALKNYSTATTVEIWNRLTGVTPVRKFKDAATAARRIFAEVQKLGGSARVATVAPITTEVPVATEAPVAALGTKHAPAAKARPVKANAAKKAVTAGPRETSKTAQLIEMLRTRDGATLEEVCKKFGWQAHTTRALMSAGGALTKKHGITVISEKVGDARTYRIAS